jgi:hypothetical protein
MKQYSCRPSLVSASSPDRTSKALVETIHANPLRLIHARPGLGYDIILDPALVN